MAVAVGTVDPGEACAVLILEASVLPSVRPVIGSFSSRGLFPHQTILTYFSRVSRFFRLVQVHLRRFLLSPQAVELFWADSPEVFLAFRDVSERQAFTRHLRKRSLPMLPAITRQGILHPRKVSSRDSVFLD